MLKSRLFPLRLVSLGYVGDNGQYAAGLVSATCPIPLRLVTLGYVGDNGQYAAGFAASDCP